MMWGMAGLRPRLWLAAAISTLVALAALTVAQMAAADARDASRDLSGRLVPAAAAAGSVASEYTAERASLRDYVTDRRPETLASYRQVVAEIPQGVLQLTDLVQNDVQLVERWAAVQTAHAAWMADVAAPQLAAAAHGDWAAAQALQLSDLNRTRTRALQGRVSEFQAEVTAGQAAVTDRLLQSQRLLLAALVATVVLIVATAVGSLVAMRRWMLVPLRILRRVADRVAGGEHDTEVPAVGPTELADLGRSVETMRTRLLAAEGRFRDMVETSPDATVHVAGDGSIALVNRQAERLFGYRREELVGQHVELLVPPALRDAHPAHRADYVANPQFRPMGQDLTLTAVHRDGREFPVEISLGPLSTEQGPMVSAAIRDVTERRAAQLERERLITDAESERYERRLAQSQRLESLGQLVGGVAHDFNNLLNIILGYTGFVTEQITETAAGDPRWRHTLDDIGQVRSAADRAARLTHQLLAFGRREVTRPEVLSLNDVVAGIEPLLRRTVGEHIDLVTSLDAALWQVKADPGHLEQILVNLVVNARDALPGGGKLSIDTANIVVDETYAAHRPGLQPGRYARLRVSDTGTGMDRETLARVFEPFFTTKPTGQGTGLGLATVYGLMTQAGGHPELYSELGMGTTFSGLLPATDEAAGPAYQPEASSPGSARGETVLVVEDEPSLRDMVARILTAHGYLVRNAVTIQHALEHAGDLDQPIDLLLTDVVMPVMLGREVAARVRALRPGTPVLYMSGYAQDLLDARGTLEPGADLLEKPFTEDGLLRKVRDALDRR